MNALRLGCASAFALILGLTALVVPTVAQKKYDPGASDSEIKLGQTMAYSGPLSVFATLGKAEIAYFRMINEQGGVNGRKISMISLDDGYSPPKTVELTRQMVESDNVLAIVGTLGTPTNAAIQKYLNQKKIPQLFMATGATRWDDPKNFPWTMTLQPNYQAEARIYAGYVLKEHPGSKVAVLYQNDDFGKDFLKGFRDRLGAKANDVIVREASYEVTDPTVDSQIIDLASSRADVFLNITVPKFAVQAIRKAYELKWRPVQFIDNPAASIGNVMRPAGIEASKGIISAAFIKDPTDPQFRDDPEFIAWVAWMKKYFPEGSLEDPQNVVGYVQAQTVVQVLRQCGNDLTRENVMRQAANLRDFHPAMLLPRIDINTSPTDYQPIEEMRLQRFNGERFELFGDVHSSRVN
jgi:branched-chain amino acid transport system substrate-binding protein